MKVHEMLYSLRGVTKELNNIVIKCNEFWITPSQVGLHIQYVKLRS